MNVSSVVEECMVGKSEQTRRIYVYWLSRFQEWLMGSGGDLEHLTRADVQQYVDWLLARKKSPSTIAVAVSAIRAWAPHDPPRTRSRTCQVATEPPAAASSRSSACVTALAVRLRRRPIGRSAGGPGTSATVPEFDLKSFDV